MMNKEDIMILKAALLYIIKKSEEKHYDVYGIVKIAFYAQQIHLSSSGLPLFIDEIWPFFIRWQQRLLIKL